jgi:hypothetical protein
MIFHSYFLVCATVGSYLFLILFALLTFFELKRQTATLSKKTQALQKQLERVLAAQVNEF